MHHSAENTASKKKEGENSAWCTVSFCGCAFLFSLAMSSHTADFLCSDEDFLGFGLSFGEGRQQKCSPWSLQGSCTASGAMASICGFIPDKFFLPESLVCTAQSLSG